MDPNRFEHIRKLSEQGGIQGLIKKLQSPETQAQIKHLQSSRIQERLKNLQRPEMQKFLNVQNASVHTRLAELLKFQDVAKQLTPLSQFLLPPAVFRPSLALSGNSIQAVTAAANSNYANRFRNVTGDLAKSLSINLPSEALAAAQYTAMQRMIQTPAWTEALRSVSQSSIADVQSRYAETLRRATQLLSDESIKRMVELAESAELIEESLDTSEAAENSPEDVVLDGDVEYTGLDSNNAADILLPFLQWSILVLSIALTMAFSNPTYEQYKEPLTETVIKLTLLERALKMQKARTQDSQDQGED